MDPIVSPWIIYGIEMLDAMETALKGIVALAIVSEVFITSGQSEVPRIKPLILFLVTL